MSTTLLSSLGFSKASFIADTSRPRAVAVKPTLDKTGGPAPVSAWKAASEFVGNAFVVWASAGHIR